MTVPRDDLSKQKMSGEYAQTPSFVILSKRSASKDLRTEELHSRTKMRRSFDSPRSLRMTLR